MEAWDLAPASALRCLHCAGRHVRNLATHPAYDAYGETYTLVRCDDCAGQWTHPLPSPQTLHRVYTEGFSYKWYRDHYPAKFLDSLHRVAQYKACGALAPGPLLDYGGGVGYFSAAARLCGYQAETRDPMFEQSTQPGADAAKKHQASLEPYQTIACHHVLEHAIDPVVLLQDIYRRLRPGGTLIIAVPNAASAGYQEQGMAWVWAQPPLIHIHHITPTGLRALLSRAGFVLSSELYYDRWDANAIADRSLVRWFRRFDALWGRSPWKWATAQVNSLLRILALAGSSVTGRPDPSRAELLMIARRPATPASPSDQP